MPADPSIKFEVTQPDGITKLTLRVIGDERNGRLVTEDGYTLVQNSDGWYYYAVLDAEGELVSSSLRAKGAKERSTEDNSFLAQTQLGLAATNRIGKPDPDALARTIAPTVAKRGIKTTNNVLLILIQYPDESNTFPPSDFSALLNGPTYDLGSLKAYYSEISNGAFDVNGTVVGFYTASHNRDYYGYGTGSQLHAGELAREAAIAARDAGVNFAPFDNDGDGKVESMFIVHVGPGAETGDFRYPWSHSSSLSDWGLSPVSASGKTVDGYTMQPELLAPGARATIGVYAHEYGHALGLPDLYDIDGTSEGIGHWCLMSRGGWNGPGRNGQSPAHMSAWCKQRLGWLPLTQPTIDALNYLLGQVETNQACFKLRNAMLPASEYFLVENRQRVGFDTYLPGCGVAIWHIDDSQTQNYDDEHRLVDLEEADGDEYPSFEASDLWVNGTFSGAATMIEVRVRSTACAQSMNTDLKVGNPGDADGDGVIDNVDNCPITANSNQLDTDLDAVGDVCDNCPLISNTNQLDADGDLIGDACDGCIDVDGDGLCGGVDNCPTVYNPPQLDSDGDGVGDACQCQSAKWVFDGETAYQQMGSAVSGAGDVNHDGFDDVIMGAAEHVNVRSGNDGSLLLNLNGGSSYDLFGSSVATAGDVNGDTYADVIVGAPFFDHGNTDGGRASIYSGQNGNLLFSFFGTGDGDALGVAVAGGEDLDGDQIPDVVVSATQDFFGPGYVMVYKGNGALLRSHTGEGIGDSFGSSVAYAGDVNNDNTPDYIVGAPYNDAGGTNAGRAYVFSGTNGNLLYTFTGDNSGFEGGDFGRNVGSAGDVNSDGFADVIVGAPTLRSSDGRIVGRVYVYSGKDGAQLHSWTGAGQPSGRFGSSVAGGADFDSDGIPDLAVGDKLAAKAFVFSGQNGEVLVTFTAESPISTFGNSVAMVGDVNADGNRDLAFGDDYHGLHGLQFTGRVYVYTMGDPDHDGVLSIECDNCLTVANPDQEDADGDGLGDACDSYVCGDADANGFVNISDAVYLINYIFAGGPAPNPQAAGDADCNGFVNISDAVYLINYIFGGGPAPCAGCR
jgi:M6 family metalloprotease-like protein